MPRHTHNAACRFEPELGWACYFPWWEVQAEKLESEVEELARLRDRYSRLKTLVTNLAEHYERYLPEDKDIEFLLDQANEFLLEE